MTIPSIFFSVNIAETSNYSKILNGLPQSWRMNGTSRYNFVWGLTTSLQSDPGCQGFGIIGEKEEETSICIPCSSLLCTGVWVISQSILINGVNYSNYQFRLKLSEGKSVNTYAVERERSKTFHKATKHYFGIPIRCLGYY